MYIESILAFWPVGIIIVLLLLLLVGIKIFVKPNKCIVCNLDTLDSFVDSNDKRTPMCRNHLVKRFRDEFLISNFNMIVIEPDFERFSAAYLYAIPKKLLEWEYPQEASDKVSDLLALITGKNCDECRGNATVGFLKKEDYELPFIENISVTPKYLCKNCALRRIESLIQNSKSPFVEGLYAPIGGDGIYHVQEF